MSEPLSHASIPAPTTSTDIDLYCFECGYSLRGLSGDPRRCPECGYLNPVGDLEIPAETITLQLRKMESNPAICSGMVLVFGTFTALFCIMLAVTSTGTNAGEYACFLVPAIIAAIIWVVCTVRFRSSCRARPGWEGVLWQYHLHALGLCVLVGGPLLTPLIIFNVFVNRYTLTTAMWFIPSLAVALTLAIWAIRTLGRRAHRKLKDILEPLQREMAVNIAREVLRRRLTRHRSW